MLQLARAHGNPNSPRLQYELVPQWKQSLSEAESIRRSGLALKTLNPKPLNPKPLNPV